ncbi:MAG: GIY-YIG nuclease family protein [bacterium]|nr:GIY-YIG nuclease family protein [bacterium]
MLHFTYVLECSDKTLYVGCTNDILKRLREHNGSKRGAHYTKIRRPVVLKHSETFRTLAKARAREAEIKRWSREKKIHFLKAKKARPQAKKTRNGIMHIRSI